jgi:hypothetical protein
MSIVKRGNSKYWYMSFQFNGQAYIRSTRTTNKKTAEQMEIEWKSKLHSNQYLGRKQRSHWPMPSINTRHQSEASQAGPGCSRNGAVPLTPMKNT